MRPEGKRGSNVNTSVMGEGLTLTPLQMENPSPKPLPIKHKVLGVFPQSLEVIAYGRQCRNPFKFGDASERRRKPLNCLGFVEGTTK